MLLFSRGKLQLCLRDHRSRSSLARAPLGALVSEIQPHVPKYVRVAIFGASKVHEKSMRAKTWFLRCKMIHSFSRCWTSYASSPITCCWSNFALGRAIVTWISKRMSLFHENISFVSTKYSSSTEGCFDEMFFQNGRVQKRAFGLDETLICNSHLGSAARLRRLG